MKKLFKNKIISATITLAIVISSLFISTPKRADAQLAVLDSANLVQNTLIASAMYAQQLKEYVADGIVTNLGRMIIKQMTGSIVNWINSGFEGSPSFMQNPGSFFLDTADQITGDFLNKYGGDLKNLCGPFSLDLRLALSFKYHPRPQQRYSCTLSTIIGNTKNAVNNASINGFTAGDFKQGGIPAFVSLTTEPQNNPYGAYLTAESDLTVRVANAQLAKRDEISNGRGFLSWRDPGCKKEVEASNNAIYASSRETSDSEYYDYAKSGPTGGGESNVIRNKDDCPIQTPGSAIAGQLDKQLGIPADALNLSDEINEIVGALFAQLATKALQGGLGGLSGKGAGDKSSYLSELQSEVQTVNNTGTSEVEAMKTTLLQNMPSYISIATDVKNTRDSTLNLLTSTKSSYESARACFEGKLSAYNSSYNKYPYLTDSMRNNIKDISDKINGQINPLINLATTAKNNADTALNNILKLRNDITSAVTIKSINISSQELSGMVTNGTLPSATTQIQASEEYNNTSTVIRPLSLDASKLNQDCQALPQ